jgi:hypothetical protein
MKLNPIALESCICAVMILVPAGSLWGAARECVVAKPTPASATWNFHQEADNIFTGILRDAQRADYHAEQLRNIVSTAEIVDWPSDVNEFNGLQTAVDDMGGKLCRLETIRPVLEAWQQKAVDRIAKTVTLLADNTQDALLFGDKHRETLWMPTYQRYTENLYSESHALVRSMQHAVKLAHAEA